VAADLTFSTPAFVVKYCNLDLSERTMTQQIRIEGSADKIEQIRRHLLTEGIPASEAHDVVLDSKQLSTPWTAPEIIEGLKFIAAVLQTGAAGFAFYKGLRDFLGVDEAIVVQQEPSGAQLKINKETPDGLIKDFAGRTD
jgi:hypothetical protein